MPISIQSANHIAHLKNKYRKLGTGTLLFFLLLLLWNYSSGYQNAISWEVTTTADTYEFPAWSMNDGLIDHQITGEKLLLKEKFSGSEIQRNVLVDQLFLSALWIGICLLLAISTYFNRYLFFSILAAFALMINRLNLFEVGLFGIESRWVMLLPFGLLSAPLIYFHEYRKDVSFLARISLMLAVSVVVCLGISDTVQFTNHFLTHSLFSFALIALAFLFLVSEEIVYAILFVVTSTKGGKSNHLHFIILSLIYLGNLILYYLNKSGIYENSFFFFDPFILLAATCLIATWSIKFKNRLVSNYIPEQWIYFVFVILGAITMAFLSLFMFRGMDAVYQSFHYFILYFHIGFGVLFLLYLIANFLDPLIKGFPIHRIAYQERNFPYVTARLGGLVCVCAFYFLAGQEPYNLLRSGYYALLSEKEETSGNALLSKEYLIQSEFLGYNTHYPNYQLGWMEWYANKEFRAQSNFFNAAQRFPSPFALVNYGNIESEVSPNKVQANYEEALRWMDSPEIRNNLGLIHLEKGELIRSLTYFEKLKASNEWNNAPMINKWHTYQKMGAFDTLRLEDDFKNGNYGVKANILASRFDSVPLDFEFEELVKAPSLHRQAYLVNSSYELEHDSLEGLLRREISNALTSKVSNSLSMALALYLYDKGEVNNAFLLLDELQANSNEFEKGKYLDAMAKLSLEQCAYESSLNFFNRAIEAGSRPSRLNRIEALAALGQKEAINQTLLALVKEDPGLTSYANEILEGLDNYAPRKKEKYNLDFASMEYEEIYALGSKNAFEEDVVLNVSQELARRDSIGSYQIIVEAKEINPYSISILKQYILSALEWNLEEYAGQSLDELKSLISNKEYMTFLEEYEKKKKEVASEEW